MRVLHGQDDPVKFRGTDRSVHLDVAHWTTPHGPDGHREKIQPRRDGNRAERRAAARVARRTLPRTDSCADPVTDPDPR